MAIKIKVNGADRTVDVDGDTQLPWVLRDVLGLAGTKFGCGMALCGACTVHVDGTATRSCVGGRQCEIFAATGKRLRKLPIDAATLKQPA